MAGNEIIINYVLTEKNINNNLNPIPAIFILTKIN